MSIPISTRSIAGWSWDYNANPNPDHGYSSWVPLPDGRLFVADYTNEDSPPGKACLKGYYLRPEELPPGR